MNNDDAKSLQEFVLENQDLERLEAIVDSFNPFVAMRWTRQELRHSAFLGWLLNPRESHGLGSYCLRSFLKRVARYTEDAAKAPSVIDLDCWDLSTAVVINEWRNIDVFVQDDVNGFVAVFENKVDTHEHSDQLRKYRSDVESHFPKYRKLFSYLTIQGDPATDEGYIPIGYSEVAQFIEEMVERRGDQMGTEIRSFLVQYVGMVRRHIVEDSEIQQLCRAIYSKHQRALDLIFEHRPDRFAAISDLLQTAIAERPQLLRDHCTKSYVRFIPASWNQLPKTGEGWTPSKRMLLFELDLSKGGLSLNLVLGPGEEVSRRQLQDVLAANPAVFNKATTKVYPKWWSAHAEKWMSAAQLEDGDLVELKSQLTQRFAQFVSERLPTMEAVIVKSSDDSRDQLLNAR